MEKINARDFPLKDIHVKVTLWQGQNETLWRKLSVLICLSSFKRSRGLNIKFIFINID